MLHSEMLPALVAPEGGTVMGIIKHPLTNPRRLSSTRIERNLLNDPLTQDLTYVCPSPNRSLLHPVAHRSPVPLPLLPT